MSKFESEFFATSDTCMVNVEVWLGAFCDVQIVHICTCEGYDVYILVHILYIRNGKSSIVYLVSNILYKIP
jgi:hypothetical protein